MEVIRANRANSIDRSNWHWVDWALFGIYTAWLAMGYLYLTTEAPIGGWRERIWSLVILTVCYFSLLIFWRPGYTNRLALPFVVLFTAGSFEVYLTYLHGEQIINIVSVLLLLLGFHSKGRMIYFNLIVFPILLPLFEELFVLNHSFDIAVFTNHMLNYASLYAIGYGVQRLWISNRGMKDLYEQNLRQYTLIQEQNRALQQYASQVEKLTLLEERNRLARELHDTVGHTFTSVIMGMDAVSYLMDAAPDKAKHKLEVLRAVTRNGLDEVRRSIHQIAPQEEEGSFNQQLSILAHEFSVHTGTVVQLNQSGIEVDLPRQAQLTLIRCLQESLTNAKRHGEASSITIQLDYGADQVVLRVEDDGLGSSQLEEGFGLKAMRERLSALQGELRVLSSAGSGTILTCSIPIKSTSTLN